MRELRRALLGCGIAAVALTLWVGPAAADVVDPPGSCVGAGTWEKTNQQESSADHVRGDVIEVPRKDTVDWSGALQDPATGQPYPLGAEVPRRDVDGSVQIELPPPFGWITVDDWGGTSVRAANEGTHDYDLPPLVIGVEMTLKGHHDENGALFCEGEVTIKVKGSALSNPLSIGGIAGLVVFGGVLFYSGRPVFRKVAPAFEDINRG